MFKHFLTTQGKTQINKEKFAGKLQNTFKSRSLTQISSATT